MVSVISAINQLKEIHTHMQEKFQVINLTLPNLSVIRESIESWSLFVSSPKL